MFPHLTDRSLFNPSLYEIVCIILFKIFLVDGSVWLASSCCVRYHVLLIFLLRNLRKNIGLAKKLTWICHTVLWKT